MFRFLFYVLLTLFWFAGAVYTLLTGEPLWVPAIAAVFSLMSGHAAADVLRSAQG